MKTVVSFGHNLSTYNLPFAMETLGLLLKKVMHYTLLVSLKTSNAFTVLHYSLRTGNLLF